MSRYAAFFRRLRLAGLVLGLATGVLAAVVESDGIPGGFGELDALHRQIQALIPENGVGNAFADGLVQAGVPLLQEMIVGSRDEALRRGARPMPAEIRRQLAGFLPERVLAAARYQVQEGEDFSLQSNLIHYGDARAITFDEVIVFESVDDALHNPKLWAHELTHVDQYQRWGVQAFAARYLRDYQTVEREAYAAEIRYAAWRLGNGGQTAVAADEPIERADPVRSPAGDVSNTCTTSLAVCRFDPSGPAGTPCWCYTAAGVAGGSLTLGAATAGPRP